MVLAGREDWHLPSLSPRCLDRVSGSEALVPGILNLLQLGCHVTLFLHEEGDKSSQDPFSGSRDRVGMQTGLPISAEPSALGCTPLQGLRLTVGTPLPQVRNSLSEEGKARVTGSWERLFPR